MAIYWPRATGNWSTLSNWASSNGAVSGIAGVLPQPADDVYANSFNITMDMDINVQRLINHGLVIAGLGTISPLGSFIVDNNAISFRNTNGTLIRNITGGVLYGGAAGSGTTIGTNVMSVDITSPRICNLTAHIAQSGNSTNVNQLRILTKGGTGTLNISGNILRPFFTGSVNASQAPVVSTGLGNFNLSGFVLGPTGGNNATSLGHGGGNINIFGFISGGVGSGNAAFGSSNVDTDFTINIYGDIYGLAATGFNNTGNSTTTVYGNVFGGNVANIVGIANSGNAQVIVYGNSYGGIGSSSHGISNSSTGSVTLCGSSFGGPATSANGVNNSSTGVVLVRRAVSNDYGRNSSGLGISFGLSNTSIYGTAFAESLSSGIRGAFPTSGNILINRERNNSLTYFGLVSTQGPNIPDFLPFPNATYIRAVSSNPNYSTALSGITGFTFLYSALSGDGSLTPPVSDVRLNAVYNFFTQRGTVYIPIPQTVTRGVSVDNTFGTAIADPSLVWVAPLSSFVSSPTTLGYRINDCITVESVGDIIKDLD